MVTVPVADELTQAEKRRYGRHLILPEVGRSGQLRLKRASVLLVGAGGLGSPAALYLAAAGVGRLGVADFDRVDESNLQRQILYSSSDVGRPKVEAARDRIAQINPHVEVELVSVRIDAANALDLFARFDLVVDGSDNFSTRYLVNDACVLTGRPNVYGSIYRFEGQVSVFGAEGGPCYRCLFPEPPPPGAVPSCAEAGVLGVLPGIVGSLQASEAIKLILGEGEPLIGRLLLFDALKGGFRELRLPRDPECSICGDAPTRTTLENSAAACEPEELSGAPERAASADLSELNLESFDVTVRQVASWREAGEGLDLVDVRNRIERDVCCLAESRWLPLDQLPGRFEEIDRDRPVIVYCHHGIRSAQAVHFLRAQGFDRVWNLSGGIDAWSREVDPAMPRY